MWPFIIAGFIALWVLVLVVASYRWQSDRAESPPGEEQPALDGSGVLHPRAQVATPAEEGPTWWGRHLGFQRPIGILFIVGGLWHAAAPWINGYSNVTAAAASNVASGLALAAVGVIFVALRGGALVTWAAGLIGLWVLIAPQVLGFSGRGLAAHDAIWGGPITIVLAVLAALARRLGGEDRTAPAEARS